MKRTQVQSGPTFNGLSTQPEGSSKRTLTGSGTSACPTRTMLESNPYPHLINFSRNSADLFGGDMKMFIRALVEVIVDKYMTVDEFVVDVKPQGKHNAYLCDGGAKWQILALDFDGKHWRLQTTRGTFNRLPSELIYVEEKQRKSVIRKA